MVTNYSAHPSRCTVMFYVLLVRAFGMWDQVVSLYGSPNQFIKHLFYGDHVGFTREGHMYVTDCECWSASYHNGAWDHQ